MKLSILIPAYQEEDTIAQVIAMVDGVDISPTGFSKEIIVCDDGSTDRTYEIAADLAKNREDLVVLRHEQNQGKGASIRTALRAATGSHCLVQDADLEYDAADYPALLEPLAEGAPVVFGSRFLAKSWPTGMQLPNYVANKLLTTAANTLFGLSITDEATCFKAFETELLRSLMLECDRFEFCPEVIAKLGRRGISILEVPIRYQARTTNEGKKIGWTDGVTAMWTLVKYRVRK